MLEKNDIQCWLTTAERIALPEINTSSGEHDIITCTVKLHGRKSYIINWSSKIPITAWCEIHTKSPNGKTTKGISKCEMDATIPGTQQRTSQDGISSGRNLGFYGRRLSSTSLGMAWLEIRRATSIRVSDVSKGERQLTIDWLPSDRPDVGTPYVTFVFNFELAEPFAHGSNSPTAPRYIQPAPVARTLRPIDKSSATEKEREEKYSLRSLVQSSANSSTTSNLAPPPNASDVDLLSTELEADPPSTTSKTVGSPNEPEPASAPTVAKPALPPILTNLDLPSTTSDVALLSSSNSASKIQPSVDSSKATTVPSKVKITIQPISTGESHSTPESGPSKKRKSAINSPLEPARVSKQPRINASAGPSKSIGNQDDLAISASATQHNKSKDPVNYAAKNAKIEADINRYITKLSQLREKERYMELKRERLHLLAELRAAELEYGPLSPNKYFFQEWSLEYDSNNEGNYVSKRRKIESDIPALRIQLAALREKKDYREKKARLKQLKDEIQATEIRCKELEQNISRINDSAKDGTAPKT